MNRREKTLLLLVGIVVGALVVGGLVRAVFLKPLRQVDKDIASLRTKLAKAKAERRAYFEADDQIRSAAQHSFAETVDQASAKSGEILTRLIIQSGLQEDEFTRLPVGPRRLRGADEIGWNVQGEGALMSVINLLFLLQESPYIHRLDGIVVSPAPKPGRVDVHFRFLTLVINPAPTVDPIPLAARFTLDSPERRILDSIVTRDILRPYLRRPPPPRSPGPGTPPPTQTVPLGPENFRIVDLSEWEGHPEIAVLDKTNQRLARYKPGDPLAGGVIVMVDTRPLPKPGRAGVKSFSRVIVQIGAEYWAVELGQTLAEKYKLEPEQLPERLSRL